MSDKNPKSSGDEGEMATMAIAYCPHLGIYYHKTWEGEERFFDREGLEAGLEKLLREHKPKDAQAMAELTSHARHYPHVCLVFKADGTFMPIRMEIPKEELGLSKLVNDPGESKP